MVPVSTLQCPTTIILARHGEAEYEQPLWGDVGGSLTPLGRGQARDLVESLRGKRISHVWCSSYSRAVQTAEIAAALLGVGVAAREGLREFVVGDLAGTPLTDDPFGSYFKPWLAGDLSVRVPGGESGAELRDRFRVVLEEIADRHPGETVLAVTHGGIMRSMVPELFRMAATPARIPNCGTIELRLDADDWVCVDWAPGPACEA